MNIDDLVRKLRELNPDDTLFIADNKELSSDGEFDSEDTHLRADHLLLEFINNNDVTTAFYYVPKWYS